MADEEVDVINENDEPLGFTKLKSKVHIDGDWHRGAHLWIVKDGKILLQKRAYTKEIYPGKFDVACAGHVKAGETPKQALIRELKEELSINAKEDEFIFLFKDRLITKVPEKRIISREVNSVFLYEFNGDLNDLKLQKEEVDSIKLFEIDKLKQLLKEKPEMFVDNYDYFMKAIERIEEYLKK